MALLANPVAVCAKSSVAETAVNAAETRNFSGRMWLHSQPGVDSALQPFRRRIPQILLRQRKDIHRVAAARRIRLWRHLGREGHRWTAAARRNSDALAPVDGERDRPADDMAGQTRLTQVVANTALD